MRKILSGMALVAIGLAAGMIQSAQAADPAPAPAPQAQGVQPAVQAALLPAEFRQRLLGDFKEGESGWVDNKYVMVGKDWQTYLAVRGVSHPKNSTDGSLVKVERTAKGYELCLIGCPHDWHPLVLEGKVTDEQFQEYLRTGALLPVVNCKTK